MPRIRADQENAKDLIMKAATELFMKQGYEQTSVRQILDQSGTVTGSFYHFFSSKEKLFEEIISVYMRNFSSSFLAVTLEDDKTFVQQLQALEQLVQGGLVDYFGGLQGDKLHWTIQLSLHNRTLMAILPGVEQLIETGVQEGIVTNPLNFDISTLAITTLYGVSSLLHTSELTSGKVPSMSESREDCMKYISYMLGIKNLGV